MEHKVLESNNQIPQAPNFEPHEVSRPTDFAYDAITKVFICADENSVYTATDQKQQNNGSSRFYRQNLIGPKEHIVSEQHKIEKELSNSNIGSNLDASLNILRFSSSKSSQQGVSVSPSGLTVTCNGQQSVLSPFSGSYAVGREILEKNRVYYLELSFPNGCEGIEFGIIQNPANVQSPQSLKTHLITYKYKTQKIIGLKIDTTQWALKVWINGVYEPFKTKSVPKGSYSLCLKMTLQGVTCILNPFALDPELIVTPFARGKSTQIDKMEASDVYVKELIKQIQQELQSERVKEQNKEDLSTMGVDEVAFIERSQNFIAIKENKLKLIRRDPQGRFPLHYSHFLNRPKLNSDVVYLILSSYDINVLLGNQQLFLSLSQSISVTVLQALIKSINNSTNNEVYTVSLPFDRFKRWIDESIEILSGYVKDIIQLPASFIAENAQKEQSKEAVTSYAPYLDCSSTFDEPTDGLPFFPINSASLFKEEVSPTVSSTVPVSVQPVQPVVKSQEKVQENGENKKQALVSDQESESEEIKQRVKELASKWDLKSLQEELKVILKIDEQLFAMTLHNDSSSELILGYSTGVPRIFSAFSRLISFYSYVSTSFSFESLAEAGLINIYDLKNELRHFLDLNTPLEINQGRNQNLSLEEQIDNQIDTCDKTITSDPHITLDVTINSLPYQLHKSSNSNKIRLIHPTSQQLSNYIGTIDNDGTVNIWEASLLLQRLAVSDFKQDFKYPLECEISSDLKKNEEIRNQKLGTNLAPQSSQSFIYKILENSISVTCKHAKKPKSIENQLTADPDKVEHLLQIGFSVTVAKKACIEVKNENIEKAIDAALRIQMEEKSEMKATFKNEFLFERDDVYVNDIKPQWSCELCTYQNIGSVTNCEICMYQAPQSAYYTQAEIDEIMEQRAIQKKIDEEKKIQLMILKEEEIQKQKQILLEQEIQEQKKAEEVQNQMKIFLESADAKKGFLLNLKKQSFSQLAIGVALNSQLKDSQNKSLLRIRKFAISPKSLNQFYSLGEKGIVSNISGQYLQDTSIEGLETILLEESNNRYVFQTLAPLTSEDPSSHELIAVQEANIFLKDDLIIDCSCRLIEANSEKENYEVVILGESSSHSYNLHIYSIKIDIKDPYNLQKKQIQPEFIRKIRVSGPNQAIDNSFLILPEQSQLALIITNEKLIYIPLSSSSNETIEIKDLKGKAVSVQLIEKDKLAVLDEQAVIRLIQLTQKGKSQSSHQQINKMNLEEVSIFNPLQIEFINNSFNSVPLGSYSMTQAITSTIKEQSSGLNSAHQINCFSQDEFAFEFNKSASLAEIDLKLTVSITPSISSEQQIQGSSQQSQLHSQSGKKVMYFPSTQGEFIPLKIVKSYGSPYNSKYHPSAVLYRNQKIFQTIDSNCAIVASSQKQDHWLLIESITIDSPNTPIEGGYPAGTFLVFFCSNLQILPSILKVYQDMTYSKYQQWISARDNKPSSKEDEPIACINFPKGTKTSITQAISQVRPSKYIVFLPTQLRSEHSHLNGVKCLSLSFMGVNGFEFIPSSNPPLSQDERLNSQNNLSDIFKVKALTSENQVLELGSINCQVSNIPNLLINNQGGNQDTQVNCLNQQQNIKVSVDLQDIQKQNVQISKVIVQIDKSKLSKEFGNLQHCILKFQAKQFQNNQESGYCLDRSLLLQGKSSILENLVKSVQEEENSQQIVELFNNIISKYKSLIPSIYSSLNLTSLLYKQLFSVSNTVQTSSLLEFFQYLSTVSSFESDLLNSALQLLPIFTQNKSVSFTKLGRKLFFSLLKYLIHKEQSSLQTISHSILRQIKEIGESVQANRDKHKQSLSCNFGVSSLCLEQSIINEEFLQLDSQRNTSLVLNQINVVRNSIPFKFMNTEEGLSSVLYIDLQRQAELTEINLVFQKNALQSPSVNVLVWQYVKDVNQQQRAELIVSQHLSSQTFAQMAEYQWNESVPNNFTGLVFSLPIFNSIHSKLTQYLVVQFNYSLRPLSFTQKEKSDLPTFYAICPIFKGKVVLTPLNNEFEIPNVFPKPFALEAKNFNEIDAITINVIQQMTSQQQQILYDSAGVAKISSRKYSWNSNQSLIPSLSTLKDIQQRLKNMLNNQESKKEGILRLVNEAESILKSNLINDQIKSSVSIGQKDNLSFSYSVWMTMSRFLRQITVCENVAQMDEAEQIQLIKQIFQVFIVEEGSGTIQSEAISLINEWMSTWIGTEKYTQFFLTIVNEHLLTANKQDLFQLNVLKALQSLKIPYFHLISNLNKKLLVQEGNLNLPNQTITYLQIAPVLALLFSTFNQAQKQKQNSKQNENEDANLNTNHVSDCLQLWFSIGEQFSGSREEFLQVMRLCSGITSAVIEVSSCSQIKDALNIQEKSSLVKLLMLSTDRNDQELLEIVQQVLMNIRVACKKSIQAHLIVVHQIEYVLKAMIEKLTKVLQGKKGIDILCQTIKLYQHELVLVQKNLSSPSDTTIVVKKPQSRKNTEDQEVKEDLLALNEAQILPVGVKRSLSASVQKKAEQPTEESVKSVDPCSSETDCNCCPEIALGLLQLLELSILHYSASNVEEQPSILRCEDSSQLWNLFLDLIKFLKVKDVIQKGVYQRISQIFLGRSYSQTVQNLLVSKTQIFLTFTQNIFNQQSSNDNSSGANKFLNRSELSYLLLKLIFENISKNQNQLFNSSNQFSSSISLRIIEGWLDILLSGETPKPESYYSSQDPKSSYCLLRLQTATESLLHLSLYLLDSCCIGGPRGAQFTDQKLLIELKFASQLVKVLLNSKIFDKNEIQTVQFLKAVFQEQEDEAEIKKITESLQNLVIWYILNKSGGERACPAQANLTEISNSIKSMIEATAISKQISKIALRESFNACQKINQELLTNEHKKSASPIISGKFIKNAWDLLEELFELLVRDEETASFAAFEISGFEFLLSCMQQNNLNKNQLEQQQQAQSKVLQEELPFSQAQKNQLSGFIESSLFNNPVGKPKIAATIEQQYISVESVDKGIAGPKQQKPAVANSPQKQGEIPNKQENLLNVKSAPVAEEFCIKAKQIKNIKETWYNNPSNWSEHKAGVQNVHISWIAMAGGAHSECSLTLQLEKPVYLSSVRVGFNSFWSEQEDKVLGIPSNVLLEVASSLSDGFTSIKQLHFLSDPGYESVRVKVAVANFEEFSQDQIPSNKDGILKSRVGIWNEDMPVQFIRFKFARPQLSFSSCDSLLVGKLFQNIAISLSFVSVIGYSADISIAQAISRTMQDTSSSAIRLIGRLCSPTFKNTLQLLATTESVIQNVKKNFSTLAQLLPLNQQCLSGVFSALAIHNREMGDWLLEKFLDLDNGGTAHARIASDIACSQLKLVPSRIRILHSFVLQRGLNEIMNIAVSGNKMQLKMKFLALLPYAEAWATAIRVSALDLNQLEQANHQQPIQLLVTEENISNLIFLFKQFSSTKEHKSIIRIVVTALNLPSPFVISEDSGDFEEIEERKEDSPQLKKSLLMRSLEQLWKNSQEQSTLLEMIAPLVLSKQEGVEWLLSNDGKRLFEEFGKLLNLLNQANPNSQALIDNLHFLSQLTTNSQIQVSTTEKNIHLNFYSCLKDTSKTSTKLLKTTQDPSILSYVVQILKNLALSSMKNSVLFAELLSKDINLLTNKRDMLFVTHLLVPLLNAERTIPISFHPFDSINGRWLSEGRKILEYNRERKPDQAQQTSHETQTVFKNDENNDNVELSLLKNSLKTNSLWTAKQHNAFFKNFEQFTKKSDLLNKLDTSKNSQSNMKQPYSLVWELVAFSDKDSDPAMLQVVKDKVLSKAPFLVIIEGMNQEQKCVSGVFSSQSIQTGQFEKEVGDQTIPRAEDSFMFYYEDGFEMHFDLSVDTSQQLGYLFLADESAAGLQFQYQDSERIFISYFSQTPTVVDINLQEMTPIDTDTSNFPKDVPPEFEFVRVEYWILKQVENKHSHFSSLNMDSVSNTQSLISSLHMNQLFSPNELSTSCVGNYLRSVPVYEIPASFSLEKVVSMISINGMELNQEAQDKTVFKSRKNARKELSSKSKVQDIIEEASSEDGIIDLEFDALQVYSQCNEVRKLVAKESLPSIQIFDCFQKAGGVQQIIKVIQESLKSWKNAERAQRWSLYMKELSSFSSLSNYFGLFMKNKDCIELLFELLAGLPDEVSSLPNNALMNDPNKKATNPSGGTGGGGSIFNVPTSTSSTGTSTTSKGSEKSAGGSKKWDEEEQKAVQYSYQVLKDTFKLGQDNSIRQLALDNHLIEAILDRIAIVSKEVKRVFVDSSESENQNTESSSDNKEDNLKLSKKESEEDGKKKISTKKGTGYGSDNTGQNQKWNISDYLETKKARSEVLSNLIAILEAFLDFKDWEPPQLLMDQIMQSALLPLIESSLRSGSLLEMSKEKDLVFTYLNIIRVMAKNSCLVPCLLSIDPRYVPKQTESILQLTSQLRDTAKIFLNCLGSKTDKTEIKESEQQIQETSNSKKLAELITKTYDELNSACSLYLQEHDEEDNNHDQNEAIKSILELPLKEKYKLLLQDQRFDYSSFKNDAGKYKHHYSSHISNTYSPPQAKMVRLAQELADLSTALPIDHTNSIFVRCDTDRVDVMKCMVMGAIGTPYAHGAFIFDVYFGDDYPNGPPKCNLETTGSGKVRFNPNLYACGKVCLSLLGTWRGNASENWDPKISTLLQILVSLQAIIMSEDVYFNEPGFEGEQGSEEGERKNEAYSNIVRYCNIKYAMIDQIKNPPEGFSAVVLRHFYLKKDEILEECQKWIKYSDVRQASYVGLVNDHNSHWCSEFKSKYPQMLREAVSELEEALNSIPAPSAADTKLKIKGQKSSKKKVTKNGTVHFDITQGVANIDDIDVGYNEEDTKLGVDFQNDNGFIDINDEKVKDRWSRYIGAMGIDAVAKQSKCNLFLSGLGSLGVEIAKNIVMSGIKRLTIHDSKLTTYNDLSGQFYLGEEDIGKNRAEQSIKKIKQLNHYVKVETALLNQELPSTEEELISQLKLQDYDIVVLTDVPKESSRIAINDFCRKRGIKFITADVYGPWCRLFNDFGDEFEVADKNGEDPVEVMIKSISSAEKGIVTLLTGAKHPFEDGEHIIFSEVVGMDILPEKPESIQNPLEEQEEEMILDKEALKKEIIKDVSKGNINQTIHKIRVINSNSFEIGDTRGFSPYIRNGVAKNIKTPVTLKFKSLAHLNSITNLSDVPFDANMLIHDFEKIDNPNILFIAFKTLDRYSSKYNSQLPLSWNLQSAQHFLELAEEVIAIYYPDQKDVPGTLKDVLLKFALTVGSSVGPFAAFLGGFVTQEIVKAITHKYLATNQLFFSDCMEIIPTVTNLNLSNLENYIKENYTKEFQPQNNREDGIRLAIGNTLLRSVKYSNVFMVGCGAIGCELLKNFSMIGLGTGEQTSSGEKGQLIITDPDHIETSNLNRQFLFREKHLRKPKSQTAAAAAIQMNPLLKGHILSRLDKVFDGTINIFSDQFFSTLTLVANALDNVQARRYVDSRCVTNKKPLLESGTLGPKGHVQVVLPYQTESYGSQQDPQEEGEIPHCTLKMFPEETLHCIEWARDKFGKLFTLRPKSLAKLLEDEHYDPSGGQELRELKEALKMIEKRPKSYEDCIIYAIKKFYKYYRNDIKQLIYTYPLDSKTKDGEPFWKLPKRPPTEQKFDSNNPLHRDFISSLATLRSKIYKIDYPKNFRTEEQRKIIAEIAEKVQIEEFKASDEKAQTISSQVNKNAVTHKEDEDEVQENEIADNEDKKKNGKIIDEASEKEQLMQQLSQFKKSLKAGEEIVKPEEFEKDEDENGHIDLIYAMANCRSQNYKLAPMDWIQVKIKAGRIVPALATTTATVAGLQTIELIKILKNEKLSNMKNAFLNLAVPLLQLTEPQKAEKIKIHEELQVTLWDRWEVSLGKQVTLKQVFSDLLERFKLKVCDVMSGSKLVYSSTLMDMPQKEHEKEKLINANLADLIETEEEYVDFIFTFSNLKGEKVKQTPLVRVKFI